MHRRREWLLYALSSPLLLADPKQSPLRYRNYSRVFPDYLRSLAEAAYRRRLAAVNKIQTPQALRERQQWVRRTFWELIGGEPERTPLNAKVTGSYERSGYRLEKVVYESFPGLHISANLYIPTTARPPYPGVLFQMGHAIEGKAGDVYQRCCQGLARLGFLVLGFDPMGQGERAYYPDATGTRTRFDSADTEHTVPGKQMLLYNDTSTRLQLWDAVRSLDYLASHPLVDPKRLATTGQSGGATNSMMLAAVDDRLAAAAITCGNMENFACAGFDPPGSTDDAEQNFVASAPVGFDRWDMLYPLAPKPLLVLVSARDSFGTYSPRYLDSGWEEFQHLKRMYALMGKAEHLAWDDTPLPHGLAYYPRLQVYKWMRRHLQPDLPAVTAEPEVAPEKPETLWVSESGSVVRSFRGQTPFSLNQRRAPKREGDWQKLLHLEERPATQALKVVGSVPSKGMTVEAIEVESAPGVYLPAWFFRPQKPDPNAAILLILEPQGRNSRWQEGALYHELAASGITVCAADVRGTGDLVPEYGRGSARYTGPHHEEDHYAWASLMLGRPLVGQRVTDILALVRALSTRGQIRVAASGKMTVPALFAAALEPRVQALLLSGGLTSFTDLVRSEDYKHPFANFVPGLLLHSDLPDIARSLAPRPLTVAAPVDSNDQRVPPSQVQSAFSNADHIRVLADPGWSLQSLMAFSRGK
jgi:dienelactone hydrolase